MEESRGMITSYLHGILMHGYVNLPLGWVDPGCHQVPTKAALSLPLLNYTGKTKYKERLMGWDKDSGGIILALSNIGEASSTFS